MDLNLINNIGVCLAFKSEAPMALVRYSHIPTMIISMLIGIFVFIKNRHMLSNKIMLAISSLFSLWVLCSLIIWEYGYNSVVTMFAWSLLGIFSALISIACLYFVYVFIDKKDISFIKKIIFGSLLLPVIILAPTRFNLTAFDATNCNALEWDYYSPYYYILGLVVFVWIIILTILRYRKAENNFKKQIVLLTMGIGAFVLTFSAVGFIISYLVSSGIIAVFFNLELYALFGMPVFMGFLAYLIVKFKAFNIKLIGAQALVIALITIIGSQFFFIQNNTNRILTGITLALALGFGYFLIKSVKAEVKRKEELQYMSDQLAKANDQLKKLDNAKSDFISIASHQLRTPLTSIKGFISLLSEGSYGKITPVQQETLNKVYQSNERLIHLVEDLLDISRIESGRMEFEFASCQLADLCQEVVDGFVIRAKNSKLYLDYKKPTALLPEVMIDAGKVREVISNMVDNALKYTRRGGVSLKIESDDSSKYQSPVINNGQDINGQSVKIAGSVLRVIISDTGIGIPVTELPYLFSKFSRGKDIGRLNAAGTGLGLYVGRSMIEANGGHIWAESEGEGKGSRFIIELPVKQSEEILAQWGK